MARSQAEIGSGCQAKHVGVSSSPTVYVKLQVYCTKVPRPSAPQHRKLLLFKCNLFKIKRMYRSLRCYFPKLVYLVGLKIKLKRPRAEP